MRKNLVNSKEIFEQPAWKIAKEVQNGRISARGVAEQFIERTRLINPHIRAWVSLDEKYYLAQADEVDNNEVKGQLAGVPVGVKDIFNTEVYPTEMGTSIWKGHKAGNDARCVSYVRREQGIIAGKTDTAEFAVHNPGSVKNPWNSAHVAGTSSGGSAAAVATAMAPVALGTQTAGSTIRPASWCGVYGMKPSFGLIPRTGVLKTTDTLDNIGYYGRDRKDLKLMLDVLRVRGGNYPTMEKQLSKYSVKKTNWKVAFVRGHLWNEASEYVKESMEALASDIDCLENVNVFELDLPGSTLKAHNLHRRIYNSCLNYYFQDELINYRESISETFMDLVNDGKLIAPQDYVVALKEQEDLTEDIYSYFDDNDIDIIIHHSSIGSAPLGKEPKIHNDLNLLWTLSRVPVINVPKFKCPNDLPYGFQIIGPRYSDYSVLNFLKYLVEEGIAPEISEVCM